MELDRFAKALLSVAMREASDVGTGTLEPLHLLAAVCDQEPDALQAVLAPCSVDLASFRQAIRAAAIRRAHNVPRRESGAIDISQEIQTAIANANRRTGQSQTPISVLDYFYVLLSHPDPSLAVFFTETRVPIIRLLSSIDRIAPQTVRDDNKPSVPMSAAILSTGPITPGPVSDRPLLPHPPTPTLDKTGRDLTALARAGKLAPVVGRTAEMRDVMRVLLQRERSNPILIGDAGVGKTAVVLGIAQKIVAPSAKPEVRDLRLVELTPAGICAGIATASEVERRMRDVAREAAADPNLILFLEGIHILLGNGDGKALDASGHLRAALANGTLRSIGTSTEEEYRKALGADSVIERHFQRVSINEPSRDETAAILHALQQSYEVHHAVVIDDSAIDAAIDMSIRYLPDGHLPAKACDLIDRACAFQRFTSFRSNDERDRPERIPPLRADDRTDDPGTRDSIRQQDRLNTVTNVEVASVVSKLTGIPVAQVTASERDRLLNLETLLGARVLGQSHAIDRVCRAIRTARTFLARPNRPWGVFLFVGPTGVGKTELAKALAELLFGNEKALLRYDMSEYQEQHSINRLIGAPPGFVGHEQGGQLTRAVAKQPFAVILLDEFEKAHEDVHKIFLQLFDDGRLTDGQGRVVDFSNTVIILTSNIAVEPHRAIGLQTTPPLDAPSEEIRVREVLARRLSPELVNRISEIIQFRALGPDDLRGIIDKATARIAKRLQSIHVQLRVSRAATDLLVRLGYHPEFNAREIERTIEREVTQPLANDVLKGRFPPHSVVMVDAVQDQIVFSSEEQ